MYNRTGLTLMTYTNEKYVNGTYKTPNRALLNVTNVISYVAPFHTKFSLMQGQTYQPIATMTDDEIKAMNSGWYAMVAI